MDFDAFNAGIEPGGLRSKNDIRILICYMLCGAGAPLSKNDIITVMVENGFANYFEVMDAISGLASMGSIDSVPENPDLFSGNDRTREISQQLNTTLPSAVRNRAVACAVNLLAAAERERENKVEIEHSKNGYKVTCHVSGGEMDLMSFSLYVPDFAQAKLVRKQFLNDPELVYRALLALVTGEQELVADILKRL